MKATVDGARESYVAARASSLCHNPQETVPAGCKYTMKTHYMKGLRMVCLPDYVSEYVLKHCPARTDEALRERFGISYNTLRKIQSGDPIRRSVATRLEERVKAEVLIERTCHEALTRA